MSNVKNRKHKGGKPGESEFVVLPNPQIVKVAETYQEIPSKAVRNLRKEVKDLRLGLVRAQRPRQSLSQETAVRQSFDSLCLEYCRTIIDPWNVREVKFPSCVPIDTTTFSSTDTYSWVLGQKNAKSGGSLAYPDAAPWVNAGVAKFHPYANVALTGSFCTYGDIHEYYDAFIGGLAYWPPALSEVLYNSSTQMQELNVASGVVGVSYYDTMAECEAILSTFSAIRLVSAGLRLTYDGPPLNAQGNIAIALLPGTQALRVYGATGNGTRFPISTVPDNQMQTTPFQLDYDTVANLEGARTYGVSEILSGIEASWRPQGDDAGDWNSTGTAPSLPEEMMGSTGYFGTYSLPANVAGTTGGALAMSMMCLSGVEYNSRQLGGTVGSGGVSGYSADPTLVEYYVQALSQTLCSPGCPQLVWAMDGANGANDASSNVTLKVTTTANFEGIPFNRTFSLASASANLMSQDAARLAHVITSKVPHSHTKSERSTMGSLMKHVESAVSLGGKILRGAVQYQPQFSALLSRLGSALDEPALGSIAEFAGDAAAILA